MNGDGLTLPDGWSTSTIESLAEPKGIGYGVLKPGSQVADGVPMLRVTDIRDGQVDQSSLYRIGRSLDKEFQRTKLRGGEVVLSIQGSVGRVAVVPDDLAGANVSRTLAMIRLVDPSLAPWVYRALESPHVQQAMRQVVGGTTRDSLNLRDLRQLTIPLAPEGERRDILSLIDKAETLRRSSSLRVTRAERAIVRFRQSVLAAACAGQLTAPWRVERGMADYPTDDLPAGWSKETLDDLGEWRTGGTPSRQHPEYFGGDVPWVKSGDLRDGPVKATEEKLTPEALRNSSAKLMPVGTVAVALYGATIGRLGVFEIEAATNQACANCVPNSGVVDRWFLFYYLLGQRPGLVAAGQGGAQPNLTNRIVRDWPIALPPIEEQYEIVRRVDQFLALADVLRQRIDVASARIDRSSQAVLAKAFRGDLTLNGSQGA